MNLACPEYDCIIVYSSSFLIKKSKYIIIVDVYGSLETSTGGRKF